MALGNFDGLHIGHRKVVSLACGGAAEGLLPTVLTFAENPRMDLGGGAGGRLLSQEDKIALLKEMGVKQLYILEFHTVKDLTAEEFVEQVLVGRLKAKKPAAGLTLRLGAAAGPTARRFPPCAGSAASACRSRRPCWWTERPSAPRGSAG